MNKPDIQLVNRSGDIISLKQGVNELMVFGTMNGVNCYEPMPKPRTERDRALFRDWINGVVIDE